MDLFYDADKEEYYCLRCAFVGTEEEILEMNQVTKKKYKLRMKRVTSFGEDDGSIETKDYQKGEL